MVIQVDLADCPKVAVVYGELNPDFGGKVILEQGTLSEIK
jgi:hypothetical protein